MKLMLNKQYLFLTEGKKKGNKQDAQGKSSNQVEPASNSKSEHQQKKEEVQQQQDKQTEQLFLVQSDMVC